MPSGAALARLSFEALTPDGLLLRSDGAFVRYLDIVPRARRPRLRASQPQPDRLIALVPAGVSVRFHARATISSPISAAKLLPRRTRPGDQAQGPAPSAAKRPPPPRERARDAVAIRLGPHWLATSGAITDLPLRNRALERAEGDP